MKKLLLVVCFIAAGAASAFAVDGQVLINQAAVVAAGGYYTITQPGSYKLSGNLTFTGAICETATPAFGPTLTDYCIIKIQASDVTVDLGGFTMTFPDGFGNSTGAFLIERGFDNLTIRNGNLRLGSSVDLSTLSPGTVGSLYLPGWGPLGAMSRLDDLHIVGGLALQNWGRISGVHAPSIGITASCPGLIVGTVAHNIVPIGSCLAGSGLYQNNQ